MLDEDSRKYMTVTTHIRGCIDIPDYLLALPQPLRELWNKFYKEYPGLLYLDDLLIMVRDEAEHLQVLRQVLERLWRYGLHLKRSKCQLMQKKVIYLVYLINTVGEKVVSRKPQDHNV